MTSKETVKAGSEIILKNGSVGTVKRVSRRLCVVEIMGSPKVKRPSGYFYKKKILRLKKIANVEGELIYSYGE